ncbi:hypothetical protein [Desulfovibrio gilichinskyi]|uniref:Uncharacterized protein n=1 Tax=Desulfovibrio gilichinskyi TaxID=1519643 RepID=A0A1X7CIG6_9BACT|nr:hypothetical protein [Desulfovibrio gilichinskyi]SME96697.1 hypothetical protein SAMN06295933_0911 [Desulfovibrio gilichinskyi]
MNALAKLQSKYKKGEPETAFNKFKRLCQQEEVEPISEDEFNRHWQSFEIGHKAMKKLGVLIREHRQMFMVKRNKADELVVVIDEAWGKANGETVWQMWELFEQAAPLICLCYLNRLPFHGDEPPKKIISTMLPLGTPQRSPKHG